jgi:putative ABC transport system permease protein
VGTSSIAVGPALVVVLVAFATVAGVVGRLGHLGTARGSVTAAVRAAVQLAAVSVVITAAVGSLAWTAVFVAAMCTIATWTSARRLTRAHSGWWTGLAIAPPALAAVALLLAAGVLPVEGLAIVPAAGILIGGAMTATSLAGRRVREELTTRRGEVEAALSLGLEPRDAAIEVARPVAASALLPALDQTRTVGLVTLPGAYVGLLLAGASPLDAGAAQLLVLVALLAVESVAVVVVLELVARGLIE